MFLKLPMNPGYAGTSKQLNATAVYRNQWVGFPGAPKTFLFSIDAPIKALHGGAGISVINDRLGNFNFTSSHVAYSFFKPIGQAGLLAVGLDADIIHTIVINDWLTSSGSVITAPNSTSTKGNLGIGMYYKTEQLYVGFSATQMLEEEYYSYPPLGFSYSTRKHYYFMAGYKFFLSSRMNIQPSLHVKSDAAVTTFDASILLFWNDLFWVGTSYRLQDAIIPMAGILLSSSPKLSYKIGYAYDIGISDLKAYHDNTHEILLTVGLKLK